MKGNRGYISYYFGPQRFFRHNLEARPMILSPAWTKVSNLWLRAEVLSLYGYEYKVEPDGSYLIHENLSYVG